MEENKNQVDPQLFKINWRELGAILVILIISCFAAVFIFTRNAIFESLSFSNSGQIGDTIGGISSPIINIGAAILVYISFREQNKANKLQRLAIEREWERTSQIAELNYLEGLFKQIQETVNNTALTSYKKKDFSEKDVHTGETAYLIAQYFFKGFGEPTNKQLVFLTDLDTRIIFGKSLVLLFTLTSIIEDIESKPSSEKRLLLRRLGFYYYQTLHLYFIMLLDFTEKQKDDYFAPHHEEIKGLLGRISDVL